jgi:serine/threonine protein phosphatase PrpC
MWQDPRRGVAGVLQEAAQLVVQAAKDRGSTDNLTCLILLLNLGGVREVGYNRYIVGILNIT